MQPEVEVKFFNPLPGIYPSVLTFTHFDNSCCFQVAGTESLARWLAWLFEHRDDPETEVFNVGQFGSMPVIFYMDDQAMWLSNGPDPGVEDNNEGFLFYIPKECLNELTEALAQAHRRAVENPSALDGGVEDE
jgi:hypothetical protein